MIVDMGVSVSDKGVAEGMGVGDCTGDEGAAGVVEPERVGRAVLRLHPNTITSSILIAIYRCRLRFIVS